MWHPCNQEVRTSLLLAAVHESNDRNFDVVEQAVLNCFRGIRLFVKLTRRQ